MTNEELARAYLNYFCGGDIDGMEAILAPDLIFTGTLHSYHSRTEYLDSLRQDPPEECGCNILSITENKASVAVFYEYIKPDQRIQIAQLFKFDHQQITEVLLIFDARDISR